MTSGGRREAELMLLDTSQKLGKDSALSEGGLRRVRQVKQSGLCLEQSGCLCSGGVDGAV